MEVLKSVSEMMKRAQALRAAGKRIALVPTMGALHDGHLRLMMTARQHADVVIASIFVNPAQFGPNEDFERYPRDLARDTNLAEHAKVDFVFAPEAKDMYPAGFQASVSVPYLSDKLEGKSRPGHFRGVCTVVLKLFNICQPQTAVFGWKDAQQFIILSQMVKDLNLPIKMVAIPTVRESDGLAMSSRNVYLTPEQRQSATCLARALKRVHFYVKQQHILHCGELTTAIRSTITSTPGAELDYAVIVSRSHFEPLDYIQRGNTLVALAVKFGKVRLIDNTRL